ncbi:MAG: glycine--tRNA ligase [Candidatus Marsarchaeota archaeon]|nr:glycine--tRNA ligase [Candidatus Marsarchaeota archaeon]
MERGELERLINLCARRGIVIPSFRIYGERAGFYDYGAIGTKIKRRIENEWRSVFVEGLGNIEIESTLVAPEVVFEASGHLKNFVDPIVTCKSCGSSYRADKLLEEHFEKGGDTKSMEGVKRADNETLSKMMDDNSIRCARCNGELSKISAFNLMFQTSIGAANRERGYLRPETAQGIFMDFKEVFRTHGLKLPVGIGQVGRVFRNEISPRNMLIRMREFSQMEMEYFFDPEIDPVIGDMDTSQDLLSVEVNFLSKEAQGVGIDKVERVKLSEIYDNKVFPNRLYAYLVSKELGFLHTLGIPDESIRLRVLTNEELPHYSKCNIDVEVMIGKNYEEVIGNAYRTDFDLRNHERASKKGMDVVNLNKKVVPHVIETSFGTDRLFWAAMYNSLYKDSNREWDVLLLDERLAPYRYAVFPLQRDEGLISKAVEVRNLLKRGGSDILYSESGSIGKRYAKADEIGIPYSITIDYKTLEDGTVTVRDIRDMRQERKRYEEMG